MRRTLPDLAVSPEGKSLERETYLTTRQAARYLGYTDEHYKNPIEAFRELARRLGPKHLPKLHIGKRVLYFRKDIDAVVQAARRGRTPGEGL